MKKDKKEKKSPSFKVLIPLISILIFAIIIGYLILRPKRPSFSSLKGGKEFNYILITVDTLRADRLHCYGFPSIETPYIDILASRGIKFEKCIAQTPLTLPSHTSILTGTHPLFHGVRDNGGFLVPEELVSLAELFKDEGYETAAFVAAYVLDSKWGLNQGFDYYFDKFDLSRFQKISLGSVQRPANEVMDEAISWLEERKERKFFTWIHLYDPHTPYEPPPPYDEKYPGRPYIGEIAFTDSELGRLWRFLENNNLLENSILIFAGDHGESLGEHRESTHGFFVYQEGIQVPLIFVTPFEKLQEVSSSAVVSLVDIMPTVCEMADISVPSQVQGESLMPLFFTPEKSHSYAYAETFYPRFHYGWSEIKSLQNERYKLIIAPEMELYDLKEDPDEIKNLASSQKKLLAELKVEADSLIKKFSENALEIDYKKIDEETREKLAALGYIGTFSDSSKLKGKKLANPKEKILVFNQLSKAKEIGLEGKVEEAVEIIKGVIADDPDIIDAYFFLGNIYFKEGDYEEAVTYFMEALERRPDDSFTVINIANAYRRMGKTEEAEAFILDHLKRGIVDSQFYFILGGIKVIQKKDDEAIKYYKQCLSINPSSSSSHNALAALYLNKDDLLNAEKHAYAAFGLNPKLSNVNYHLAQILEKKGNNSEAIDAYLKELEYSPNHYKASFNLSRLYRILERPEEELKYLQKTIDNNPDFPMSYFYLARIYLNRGENFEEAVALVKKGIDLKPESKDLPLGYFLLADLYNRLGNRALSLEYARKGQELAQSNTK
ncbi:MAG: sulfatase-like hydrolase/transferase [Candidatus Aminicenantaceae bacterium]